MHLGIAVQPISKQPAYKNTKGRIGQNTHSQITRQQLGSRIIRQRLREGDIRARRVRTQMAKANGWVTEAVIVGVCVETLEAFEEVEGWDVDWGAGTGGCGGG